MKKWQRSEIRQHNKKQERLCFCVLRSEVSSALLPILVSGKSHSQSIVSSSVPSETTSSFFSSLFTLFSRSLAGRDQYVQKEDEKAPHHWLSESAHGEEITDEEDLDLAHIRSGIISLQKLPRLVVANSFFYRTTKRI